jgi:hypothetical protein
MRSKQHGNQPSGPSEAQNEFHFGYFYRTLEEHVNAFAAQEGCPYSVTDIALRVCQLLQDKALREQLRSPQLVSQVRADGEGTGLQGTTQSDAAFHVRPRGRRTLSAKALKAISDAQKKRWAKVHAAQADSPEARAEAIRLRKQKYQQDYRAAHMKKAKGGTAAERREHNRLLKQASRARLAKPGNSSGPGVSAYWAKMSASQRSGEMKRRMRLAKKAKGPGSNMAGFWARMTPAQRSKEMTRRKQVAAAKKKLPTGPTVNGVNGAPAEAQA